MPVSSHKNSYDLPKKGDHVQIIDESTIMGMMDRRLDNGWMFETGVGGMLITDFMLRCCGRTFDVVEYDEKDDTVQIGCGFWFPACMTKIMENGDI